MGDYMPTVAGLASFPNAGEEDEIATPSKAHIGAAN
jgi:hypothetical protein